MRWDRPTPAGVVGLLPGRQPARLAEADRLGRQRTASGPGGTAAARRSQAVGAGVSLLREERQSLHHVVALHDDHELDQTALELVNRTEALRRQQAEVVERLLRGENPLRGSHLAEIDPERVDDPPRAACVEIPLVRSFARTRAPFQRAGAETRQRGVVPHADIVQQHVLDRLDLRDGQPADAADLDSRRSRLSRRGAAARVQGIHGHVVAAPPDAAHGDDHLGVTQPARVPYARLRRLRALSPHLHPAATARSTGARTR